VRYLLDASFVIDHLRGDPDAVGRLGGIYRAGDEPIISSVTTAEVWSGPPPGGDPAVARFLRFIEYVHAGPEASRSAGEWRSAARRRGAVLTTTDALIAATAFHLEATVLTRNIRDFELTPVRVERY
jgi:tRNA(fMet)-specific endonuclease VapC